MIVIVTDSTACLTREDAQELGVVYVSMNYSVEESACKEDYVDMEERGDFPARLRSALHTSTAQASGNSFMRAFTGLRREGFEVLCLTISSRLSGTYNNALACAREMDDAGVRVVDSLTTAGGLMLLAVQARRLIEEGSSLEETAQALEDLRHEVSLRFSVEDMEPLRRSGRLGPVSQSISTILNIRPILACEEGRLVAIKRVRGNRERIRELVTSVPEDAKSIVVMSYECGEDDVLLAKLLRERCQCPVIVRMIGPSIAIHVGDGAVGVAWF